MGGAVDEVRTAAGEAGQRDWVRMVRGQDGGVGWGGPQGWDLKLHLEGAELRCHTGLACAGVHTFLHVQTRCPRGRDGMAPPPGGNLF